MKTALFYTFLVQFVVVFAITILGLLRIVTIDKAYLDKLFYLLILETAGSVIGLFKKTKFFHDGGDMTDPAGHMPNRIDSETPAAPKGMPTEMTTREREPVVSDPLPETALPAALERLSTPGNYFRTYEALHNRFGEREEFQRRSHAELVTWRGRVRSMSSHANSVSIQLDTEASDYHHSFFASLPLEARERVFSLHKSDLIEVTGLLKTDNMPDAPSVESDDFTLIEKGPGGFAGDP